MYYRYSFLFLEKISTLLMYAEQKSSRQSMRIVLIYLWNVTGPLYSLKGRITGSKEPYLVRNTAYTVDSGSIRMRLKACLTSSFVNTDELASRSRVLVIKGKGYRSFFVKALS
jgi:hypothetical protein